MSSTTTAGRAPRSSRLFKGAPASTPVLPGTAGAVGLCTPGLGFLCKQPACIIQSVHVALTGSLPGQQERITRNTNADGEAGIADASEVWERFSQGFSLRLLHPQRWRDELWLALAPLEALFNCPIGCNAYLTPGAAQARLLTSCQRLCALHALDAELLVFHKLTSTHCCRALPRTTTTSTPLCYNWRAASGAVPTAKCLLTAKHGA